MPQPRREELAVRFGIPPLLEAWLLAEDDVDRERVRLARRTLFHPLRCFIMTTALPSFAIER